MFGCGQAQALGISPRAQKWHQAFTLMMDDLKNASVILSCRSWQKRSCAQHGLSVEQLLCGAAEISLAAVGAGQSPSDKGVAAGEQAQQDREQNEEGPTEICDQ